MANDPAIPGLEPVNVAAPAAEAEMTPQKAPAGEDAPRPYARDLTGGTRGMSSTSYVVGGLDESHLTADGESVHSFCRYAVSVRTVNRCDHCETVCAQCAEVWMYDWVFYFDRTIEPPPAQRPGRRGGTSHDGRAARRLGKPGNHRRSAR